MTLSIMSWSWRSPSARLFSGSSTSSSWSSLRLVSSTSSPPLSASGSGTTPCSQIAASLKHVANRSQLYIFSLSSFQTLSKRSNQREWRGDVLSIFLSSAPQVIKKKVLSTKLLRGEAQNIASLELKAFVYFVLLLKIQVETLLISVWV